MMAKMTDNEIINALECCATRRSCDGCPFMRTRHCRELLDLALDLINCQKAEIERLQEYYKLYYERQKEIKELNTHIEHLNGNLTFVRSTVERQLDEIKGKDRQIEELVSFQRFCEKKAIKEFVEKLKEQFSTENHTDWVSNLYFPKWMAQIDNLAKEMKEGK